jgi:hypothetical protein
MHHLAHEKNDSIKAQNQHRQFLLNANIESKRVEEVNNVRNVQS